MPKLPAYKRVPLADASVNEEVIVDRISEEAEADLALLQYLWQNGIRPGARLRVVELAPYVGTISATLDDDRTVTLGLQAAAKIWVRQISKPQPKKIANK